MSELNPAFRQLLDAELDTIVGIFAPLTADALVCGIIVDDEGHINVQFRATEKDDQTTLANFAIGLSSIIATVLGGSLGERCEG